MEISRNAEDIYRNDNYQARSFIRSIVTDRIAPLLKEHGFVKVGSSFLRIQNRMIQNISFIYSARYICCMAADVVPLYDVYKTEEDWKYQWIDIRDPKDLPGKTIEEIAGLRLGRDVKNSYFYNFLQFGSKETLDNALEETIKLLKTNTIQRLDRIVTGSDYIEFLTEGWENKEPRYSCCVSPLVADSRYDEAETIAASYASEMDENMKKSIADTKREIEALKQLIESDPDSRYIGFRKSLLESTEDKLQIFIARRKKYWEKNMAIVGLIKNRDIIGLKQEMNKSLMMAYADLEKYSKTLVKKYSIQYFD